MRNTETQMRFNHHCPHMDLESSLIPMINIVFLLLIFFMVVGSIQAPDAFPVDPPASQQSQLLESPALQLLIDAEGRIALNGERLEPGQLPDRLRQRLAEQHAQQQGMQRPDQADEDGIDPVVPISLKADGAVAMSQLRPLLAQLRELGVERVRLLTRQGGG